MKTVSKFTNGQEVNILGKGVGTVIGYVGNSKFVRIQFDNGNVIDYLPSNLLKLIVPKQ